MASVLQPRHAQRKSGRRGLQPAVAGSGTSARAAGFAPVVDRRVATLILGSFPSAASLARGQYYGHPRNRFWPLLGAVLGEPPADLDYVQRLARLLVHHIGLWDVIAECAREGSLDSAIRDPVANPLEALLAGLPRLERVFFNGASAARAQRWFAARGYPTVVLPSSSPALTIGFEAKLARWMAIAPPLRQPQQAASC